MSITDYSEVCKLIQKEREVAKASRTTRAYPTTEQRLELRLSTL